MMSATRQGLAKMCINNTFKMFMIVRNVRGFSRRINLAINSWSMVKCRILKEQIKFFSGLARKLH